ncbi:unnamed protein product [Meganyctiphanes norvegica]|uniref:Phorbol-ester/DAG-type domain-containing protein n=1 Tax=Meganyctiphanes norvegica TaxID=48144 RepID=A0AAV2SLQ1_MEGNR
MFGSTKKMNINQTTYAMAAVPAKSAVFRTTKSTKKITKSLPKISNTFPSSSPDTGLVSNEIFPCAICNIANHTKGITCFVCNRYFHVKCEGGFNKEMYTFTLNIIVVLSAKNVIRWLLPHLFEMSVGN